MYKKIYVAVDNSEHSNAACRWAVSLARHFGASVTGSHVYAAKLHDYRFKQMEYTLPEEYREEKELEKQRKIHDSLITLGLRLISDSYLQVLKCLCEKAGVPFEARTSDGKNWKKIVEDLQDAEAGYDLAVLGALGLGAVRDSLVGSVCERVARRSRVDTLIVRDAKPPEETEGQILVCVDGSPHSFAAWKTGLELSRAFGRPLEAVAVYDPYLHYSMFHSIAGVLTEQASKVFKFKEQEKLHEEVIDTGLAKIYESHLQICSEIARAEGVEAKTTLLDGKSYEKILKHIRQRKVALVLAGRIGVHSDEDMDIGSTPENLLRLAPCNVWLSSRRFVPPIDLKADAAVEWTEEARARMERVPEFVRGIARTAVLRYALEHGHSLITNSVIEKVMDLFMPGRTAKAAETLAEQAALAAIPPTGGAWICRNCGRTVRGEQPVRCGVCGSSEFHRVTREIAEEIVRAQGGAEVEEAFDGARIAWTLEAKRELLRLPAGYLRRRATARIEKTARVRGLSTITAEHAREVVDDIRYEEKISGRGSELPPETPPPRFRWTEQAVQRLERVPAGFMRDMSRQKIEAYAGRTGASEITLEVAEGGLAEARKMMAEMISAYRQGGPAKEEIQKQFSKPPD